MGTSSRGLFGFLARLRPPPPVDSDADLLGRYVNTADQLAFTGLVRRHGPMVLAVCRRRLGRGADAEDAFQAVFLARARSAHAIARRERCPAGSTGRRTRSHSRRPGAGAGRPTTELATEVPMPAAPPAWETDELKAALDAEVADLPDRFRSVVVLCLVEARPRAEAAAVLGVPVGTVDSRLNAARKRLQARLTRRGIAIGLGAALDPMLCEPAAATGGRVLELITSTVSAVLAEAAGSETGAVSPAVVELSRGVTMTTTKLRLLAALGVTLGLIGGAGAGIYFATAADPVPPVTRVTETPTTATEQPKAGAPDRPDAKAEPRASGEAALLKPFGKEVGDGTNLRDLFAYIENQTQLVLRVDVAAFQRIGVISRGDADTPDLFLNAVYATKVVLPRRVELLPTRDVLADALAQIQSSHPCTYQVRGSQLVIVPAFIPPVRPGVDPLGPGDADGNTPSITERILSEQIYGGVVRVTVDRKPATEILADLRAQTGANIVLDPRCEALDKKVLTVTLSDVRLYDALRVLADMADLKMVCVGNIYYITTAANAKAFQPPAPRPAVPMAPQPPSVGGK
ncbi:RNA polymerase sigma factor [Frigoriglobus tundricola]|uniref:RNA polymerase sigma factor 70 region 4 type 2 domain-containing protein n=1 Tax=Frigoriglobus tundricola TaxID=2774151 RepID=A0A6M5YL64_9BACT|nr:RNA polymerase sigma factor [Frigoriglobus tundricola]QJW94033.1 hypothetical protein FTUN_1552 [Frigoriglobus tundricola]